MVGRKNQPGKARAARLPEVGDARRSAEPDPRLPRRRMDHVRNRPGGLPRGPPAHQATRGERKGRRTHQASPDPRAGILRHGRFARPGAPARRDDLAEAGSRDPQLQCHEGRSAEAQRPRRQTQPPLRRDGPQHIGDVGRGLGLSRADLREETEGRLAQRDRHAVRREAAAAPVQRGGTKERPKLRPHLLPLPHRDLQGTRRVCEYHQRREQAEASSRRHRWHDPPVSLAGQKGHRRPAPVRSRHAGPVCGAGPPPDSPRHRPQRLRRRRHHRHRSPRPGVPRPTGPALRPPSAARPPRGGSGPRASRLPAGAAGHDRRLHLPDVPHEPTMVVSGECRSTVRLRKPDGLRPLQCRVMRQSDSAGSERFRRGPRDSHRQREEEGETQGEG